VEYFEVLSGQSCGGNEEKHGKLIRDRQWHSRDSNLSRPENKLEALRHD
jgi:hypothetical protein